MMNYLVDVQLVKQWIAVLAWSVLKRSNEMGAETYL